ncbi:MAG: nucleotidyltransferase domain-containing protein [bacterium]|nr:nucleotidyltransferase domain-containing protein [bacterium]
MQILKRKRISGRQKEYILSQIRGFLSSEEPIMFAYLHGSLLKDAGFNDIDLAMYLDQDSFPSEKDLFQYGLALSVRLDTALENGYETDLQLLNIAPLSFQFGVITSITFDHPLETA